MSEGLKGCIDFARKYGFVIKEGIKKKAEMEEVEEFCIKKEKSKFMPPKKVSVGKKYRNDKLGKANYEIWVWSTNTPYVKELAFEKVEGIWHFYLE